MIRGDEVVFKILIDSSFSFVTFDVFKDNAKRSCPPSAFIDLMTSLKEYYE